MGITIERRIVPFACCEELKIVSIEVQVKNKITQIIISDVPIQDRAVAGLIINFKIIEDDYSLILLHRKSCILFAGSQP